MVMAGDIVRVIHPGNQFGSYASFFKEHHIEHLMERWRGGQCFHSMVAQVLYVLPHIRPSDYPDGVAVIEELQTGNIHLIGPEGLELCEESYITPEDLLSVLAVK